MINKCNKCAHHEVCKWVLTDHRKQTKCIDFLPIRITCRWLKVDNSHYPFKCENCKCQFPQQLNYCPQCGAEMIFEVV